MSASLKATRLSMMLIAGLILLIVLLVGGSALTARLLLHKSLQATHAQIDADVSLTAPQRLEALKKYLADNTSGINQTAALTQNLGQYDQNRIVATINGYARTAGIAVSGFDFSSTTSTSGTAAPAPSNGSFSVTLGTPLKYSNFIVFLRLLEQGLMPATVTSATVTADGDNAGNVVVSSLTIKVTG